VLNAAAALLVALTGANVASGADPPAALLWSRDGQPTSQAVAVLDALRRSDEFGLAPGYHVRKQFA